MSMNHLVGARSRSSSKDGKGKRDPAEKHGEASTFSLGETSSAAESLWNSEVDVTIIGPLGVQRRLCANRTSLEEMR